MDCITGGAITGQHCFAAHLERMDILDEGTASKSKRPDAREEFQGGGRNPIADLFSTSLPKRLQLTQQFRRIEAVRGFTAVYVCLGHTLLARPEYSHRSLDFVLRFGQEAVMVFFILSGFVISWSSLRNQDVPETFGHYFLKRFIRIYSVWFLAVLALAMMSFLDHGTPQKVSWWQLLGNFFMLQDFSHGKPAVICDPIYGDAPLWSLHYEWWFYMLFPAVLRMKRHLQSHMVGIGAIAGAVTYVLIPNPVSRILMYFAIWWIGAQAAISLRTNQEIRLRDVMAPLIYVICSSVPLLVLCGITYRGGGPMAFGIHPILEARHLITSVLLLLTAFLWRHFRWIGFANTIGWFAFVAPISFSLYVIHFNSFANATYLQFLRFPAMELALYGFLTACFCYVSEILVFPVIRAQMFWRRNPPIAS